MQAGGHGTLICHSWASRANTPTGPEHLVTVFLFLKGTGDVPQFLAARMPFNVGARRIGAEAWSLSSLRRKATSKDAVALPKLFGPPVFNLAELQAPCNTLERPKGSKHTNNLKVSTQDHSCES